MYKSGNSRAVDERLLYFTYTHSRPSQKLTSSTVTCIEINVIKWRKDGVSLLWNMHFQDLHAFARHYSNKKMNF